MAGDPTGLSTLGAGAGVGEAIARILAQRLAAAKFAEDQNQNQAENSYRNRALDLTEKTRGDALAEQIRQHNMADSASEDANVARSISLRDIGGEVTPAEATRETAHGAPSSLYKPHDANLASASMIGSAKMGAGAPTLGPQSATAIPARDAGFTFQGTQPQRIAMSDLARKQEVAGNAIDQKWQELDRKASEAESRGRLAEAGALRAEAQAALAQAKADATGAKGGVGGAYSDERSVRNIQSVDELMGKVNRWTTGIGSMLSKVPESDARNFDAELNTLKANIAFGELAAMRASSKTGGALGAVSERELKLLESSLGALDTGQSPQNVKTQLQKIKDSITRWNAAQGGAASAVPSHGPAASGGVRVVSITPVVRP